MKDKRKEYALEYAGFWLRFAAGLIDLMILLAGLYILYCVVSQSFFWIFPHVPQVMSSLQEIPSEAQVSQRMIWLMVIVLLVFIIGSTVYYVVCWASSGQTVGKICLGMKIIRTDSSSVDLKIAFIRFLGSFLCIATLGIGFILIAFDSHKQGLHDRIADTYVVKLPVKQVMLDGSFAGGRIG
ncbi:MAG: RDD family protein [Dehalococcoidia bacterium]|nr:RDD family protein [Dehalococcoidia bacterium]